MIARIVRFAIPFVLALLSSAAFAQTYSITGGPYVDGYNPPYLYVFSIQLAGTGNLIQWVTGSENHEWACGNGKPSQGGFIVYTLNNVAQPCANSVTYQLSGQVINGNCKGPAQVVETFDDNSTFTGYFTYVGRRCQAQIIGGSLQTVPTLTTRASLYRCGSDRRECLDGPVTCPRGLPNCKP